LLAQYQEQGGAGLVHKALMACFSSGTSVAGVGPKSAYLERTSSTAYEILLSLDNRKRMAETLGGPTDLAQVEGRRRSLAVS
jgi:hypothetical protein